MNDRFPLYPHLSEKGMEEAQHLIDACVAQALVQLKQGIDEVYTDIVPHIESDSWINFRNDLMAGFRNYGNRRIQAAYDFKSIREEIYRDFKSEIESEIRCERITELEARIANLNATISQCHKRIQELEDEAREPS